MLNNPSQIFPLSGDYLITEKTDGVTTTRLIRSFKPVKVYDGFNRANGALGSAETGQIWTSTWGSHAIVSNKQTATSVDYGYSYAGVNAGINNMSIKATFTRVAATTARVGLVGRGEGATSTNFIKFQLDGTTAKIIKRISNVDTELASAAFAWGDGETHTLKANLKNNTFELYVDDVLIVSVINDNITKT